MKELLEQNQRSFVEEEVENLAREGLRTLVFAVKVLSVNHFQDWQTKFIIAQNALEDREL